MKKVIIKGADRIDTVEDPGLITISSTMEGSDSMEVSDGYHTFDELYEHRINLYISLCKQISNQPYDNNSKFGIWRSKNHSDGEVVFGGTWFVLGIGTEKGKQITYHLPISKWEETNFAETLEKAPEYDGHSPSDVLKRLQEL